MRSKLLILGFIILLNCRSWVQAYEPADLNGTWVYDTRHLTSLLIEEWQYSWGKGKSIVETTLEFEIEKKFILMTGMGGWIIETIGNEGKDVVCMVIYGIEDEQKKAPIEMKFHFENYDKFWIECQAIEGNYMVGQDQPWYRLSGPAKTNVPNP